MIQQPVYLVIEQTAKGKLAIKQTFSNRYEAEAYLAHNTSGFLVKGTELVDEFAPQPEPEITGPVHQHRGPVPPMAMPPTAPGHPFPVIDMTRLAYTEQMERDGEEFLTLEDQTPGSTRLDINPQFFADLMAALEQQTIEDGER